MFEVRYLVCSFRCLISRSGRELFDSESTQLTVLNCASSSLLARCRVLAGSIEPLSPHHDLHEAHARFSAASEYDHYRRHHARHRCRSVCRLMDGWLARADILACLAVGQSLRSLLGPKSMEKLLVTPQGPKERP